MKKTKWVVWLLAVALVTGLVALVAVSCGGGGDNGTETTAPESTETTIDEGKNYSFLLSLAMPSSASLFNTYVKPWTEAVAGASNGRVTFDIKEANTLVKESQQIDACLNGTSDMTAFQPDWAPGVFPILELGGMPMLFPNTEVAARVLTQLVDEYALDAELKDFHFLGMMFISASQWGGIVPVHVPADLQGVRVRSGGGVETDTISALGGTPVEAETMDLQTAISRGMFDGLFLSWSFHAGNTNKWCTNWTENSMFLRTLCLVMSKDKWNSLPAVVQAAFTDNTTIEDAVGYLAADRDYNLDNTNIPTLKDRGLDFKAIEERAADVGGEIYILRDAERAEWQATVDPVLQDWVKDYASADFPAQEILDRCRELIAQYSASSATATTAAAAETTTTAGQ